MDRLTEKCWRNLDPWECCGQDKYCKRGCHDKGGCTNGCKVPKQYVRLAQYEDLEEQGLLLKLLCKVGDTLYRVNKGAKEPVIMVRVIQLYIKQIHKDRTVMRIDVINDADMGESCYFPCDIGERIFLTRAEAEAKLKSDLN